MESCKGLSAKSGERNDPNNFRPISVLPTIARDFEKLVYEQMYAYFTENNLIQPRQSGFRSLHSTVNALLDMTNQWCLNIDRGMVSGVIFLDLKKAFDTVDHRVLSHVAFHRVLYLVHSGFLFTLMTYQIA